MALTINLTPGYTFTVDELITVAKLNLAARPTIELEGSIGTLALADGSVTTAKLADNVLSADAQGRAKMEDGFFSADATGRAKFAPNFLTAALAEETFREGVQQYAVGVYAAGTYAIALSPAATAYTAGMRVIFKPDTSNTGAVSINVNGLGAKVLKVWAASALTDVAAGDIIAGQLVEVVYDGTYFQQPTVPNRWDVGETTISVGLPVGQNHDLGRTPGVVRFALRCKTAEFGYSVGDEITTPGTFQPGATSTRVFLICSTTTAINTYRKDTGAGCTLTAANWKIVGYVRI